MAINNSSIVRISTSCLLYERLSGSICEWLSKRLAADRRGQHTTQLTAIDSVLQRILLQLEAERNSLNNPDTGVVYDNCERFDRRTVWLERLWRYFQRRFDQREDDQYGGVLHVADELVWSWYSRPIQKATALGLRTGLAPVPIPFIDTQYSPEAFPTELVPPDLKDEGEATSLLREHLNRMPTPVVRMTPSCVVAPWLAAYLAHEVGHHLQYDLLPQRKLVLQFRELIESAVRAQTGSASEAQKWGSWSREIFADMFSVFCMGPWAVWAIAELEFKSAASLNEERSQYPAPAMRLALLAEACNGLTGDESGTAALRGKLQLQASQTRQAVLDAALGVLPGIQRTLANFCDVNLTQFNRQVAIWQQVFERKDDQAPQPDIENAPYLTGAALAYWETIAGTERQHLAAACQDLGTRYIRKVSEGAPDDGPRSAEREEDVDSLTQDIVDTIWEETR